MTTKLRLILLLGLLAVLAGSPASAQTGTTINSIWQPLEPASWNVPENWDNIDFGSYVPNNSAFEGESARIDNGGTAIVDQMDTPPVAELAIGGGLVDVVSGGRSSTMADGLGDGSFRIGPIEGAAQVSGTGVIDVNGNLSNRGTFRVTGPDATVLVGGNYVNTFEGTLIADLTSDSAHTTISVTGAANLAGTLRVESDGSSIPAYGDSWTLISASGGVDGTFDTVVDGTNGSLPIGLRYKAETTGTTATLSVDSRLQLTVNRVTNEISITNLMGGAVDFTSYALRSEGLFDGSGWSSFTANSGIAGIGWRTGNPSADTLAELNLQNSYSVAVGETLNLGTPYIGGNISPPDENIAFTYTTSDGEVVEGSVQFVGAINDLVLFVDPSSGEALIGTKSVFVDPYTITSYAIRSESGSLTPGTWDSFTASGEAGSGWRTANPTEVALAELNLQESTTFGYNTTASLGAIFDNTGEQDLEFSYTTPDGQVHIGSVSYGALPVYEGLAGDYNGDGQVNLADYTVWRNNLGGDASQAFAEGSRDPSNTGSISAQDYQFWKSNFGKIANSNMVLSGVSVPEPTTNVLILSVAAIALSARQLRKRSPQ